MDGRRLPVSPRHSVLLASELEYLIDRPPQHDYVVHTISTRTANGLPLMTADIVIAGHDTLDRYPLAESYPLHFRKTYFPARLRGDTSVEYERSVQAAQLLDLPLPIGFGPEELRACLVPGQPYSRLSPFGLEPESANLRAAEELGTVAACGLWRLLEDAFVQLTRLHQAGIAHGDAELHNFIVCSAPLEVVPIDFESAVLESELSSEEWEAKREADVAALLREAVYVQCALGAQGGALAEASLVAAERLFKSPTQFFATIDRQAAL